MLDQESMSIFNTSPLYCVFPELEYAQLPTRWQQFLKQQSLLLIDSSEAPDFYLFTQLLEQEIPAFANTLLEQMSWALLSHPESDMIVWPLRKSLDNSQPLTLLAHSQYPLDNLSKEGFIALGRSADINLATANNLLCFSQALIREPVSTHIDSKLTLLSQLKNSLSLEQKIFLKNKYDALRALISFSKKVDDINTSNYLAYQKEWSAEFMRPQLALNTATRPDSQRIPVLIAMHWLELGGAEKFALDLIQRLPKEQYAIYVTTDIASFNQWSTQIADHVEAIFHLPNFLPRHQMTLFYEYLIRSRHIRLLHLHHAACAYDALYHIRRFHPNLKVIDSLHIVELPPYQGGYVEASAQRYEAFIDHHHVISQFLKKFLMQRWQVPDNKISVTYLNVDSDYFDPDKVSKGEIRQALNIAGNACLVGFIGRFSQQKQPLEFIKTAQLLQQRWTAENRSESLVFLMTGSGLLEKKIKQAIKEATGTTILLHPQVQDTRPVYQDCDVLMMPSENEGLALVSYESMAMCTPIFFTNVGAQNELLASEFLMDINQPLAVQFADAMWSYLIDPHKREKTGVAMRDYILKHHSQEQTYTEIQALYQQLLSDG